MAIAGSAGIALAGGSHLNEFCFRMLIRNKESQSFAFRGFFIS